ncbi:hypothetical protein C0Q70_13156 [Pomacea canaliculata]|uniref:Uncharacterized protein n=2 Tax=Pomacea canaliculata TaxID=400727 RepID=A0A2T7NWE8_POMCA|nr:hypothetical protein C0Q70_13156 [Pomacea canaliculata]
MVRAWPSSHSVHDLLAFRAPQSMGQHMPVTPESINAAAGIGHHHHHHNPHYNMSNYYMKPPMSPMYLQS